MNYTSLEELQGACAECMACPLGKTRTKSVFGTGDAKAELMFVGEAPGEQEDLSGVPFVGAAGKLFGAQGSFWINSSTPWIFRARRSISPISSNAVRPRTAILSLQRKTRA